MGQKGEKDQMTHINFETKIPELFDRDPHARFEDTLIKLTAKLNCLDVCVIGPHEDILTVQTPQKIGLYSFKREVLGLYQISWVRPNDLDGIGFNIDPAMPFYELSKLTDAWGELFDEGDVIRVVDVAYAILQLVSLEDRVRTLPLRQERTCSVEITYVTPIGMSGDRRVGGRTAT
jgi:hypothetical protein